MKYLPFPVIVFAVLFAVSAPSFADTSLPWGDLSVINDATQPGVHSLPNPGDGIFVPRTTPIGVDKSDRLYTSTGPIEESAFTGIVAANKSTGDSYIIKFPTVQRGGSCVFDGNSRYLLETDGSLTFQITAQCGDLRRGYDFRVCRLNEKLRCAEPPWWNFRGESYLVSPQGVTVNKTLYPWDDAAHASEKLQKISINMQHMKNIMASSNSANVLHRRFISCRNYEPQLRKYSIVEIMTGCLISSLCSGDQTPDLSGIQDGEAIGWDSPAGAYVKRKENIADTSTWVCWVRTQ